MSEEDTFLLYPEHDTRKFIKFPQARYETPVIKGVVSRLRQWPSHLLLVFLAACLIMACLMLLVFLTVIICIPSILQHRCRLAESLELPTSPKIYFLKLENRSWSTRELCYIETAARRHIDLNVYVINLLNHNTSMKYLNNSANGAKIEFKISTGIADVNESSKLTPEEYFRAQLASRNTNIYNIDISISKLFKGSKLSKIVRNLNSNMLEMAARAQLLWSSAGTVLDPSMYCHLRTLKEVLCNGTTRDCIPDKLATIDVNNDILATAVPCQAFMGFLIQEIVKNKADNQYNLQTAVERYCPRSYYCPEVRILHSDMTCASDDLDCPTVYSSTIAYDEQNFLAIAND